MIVAGLDIGNATTELVLARLDHDGVTALGATRRSTVGVKGGLSSLRAAAHLLRDGEDALGVRVDQVLVADVVPTLQRTASWPRPRPDASAPARIVDTSPWATRAGGGSAVGVVSDLSSLEGPVRADEGLLVVVPATWGFADVAQRVNAAREAGHRIGGLILESDEAVLVANRLRAGPLPIVDEVDVARVPRGVRAALEISSGATGLRQVIDPVWLARSLGMAPAAAPALVTLCASLRERSCAVVVSEAPSDAPRPLGHLELRDGSRLDLGLGPQGLARELAPGTLRHVVAPESGELSSLVAEYGPDFRDLFAVDLGAGERVPFALLSDQAPAKVADVLTELLSRPVNSLGAEAAAACIGARSTPGSPDDCAVLDIGGGTIDLARDDGHLSVAGAGDLVTAAISQILKVPTSMAELVKFHPCLRIESPSLATTEDGDRIFLEVPAPGRAVGWLCVRPSAHEYLPFSDHLTAGQWRERRFEVKRDVLGASARRALSHFELGDAGLLLTGGGACDDEIVSVLSAELEGRVVGRADIDGRYGPRWAVAWGLVAQFAEHPRPGARARL